MKMPNYKYKKYLHNIPIIFINTDISFYNSLAIIYKTIKKIFAKSFTQIIFVIFNKSL